MKPQASNWKNKLLISHRVTTQNHVTLTREHLRILEVEEKAKRRNDHLEVVRYPVEIIIVVAVLFSGLALMLLFLRHQNQASLSGLTERVGKLEKRLKSHEFEV